MWVKIVWARACVCICVYADSADADELYIFCLKAVSSACDPFTKVWQINSRFSSAWPLGVVSVEIIGSVELQQDNIPSHICMSDSEWQVFWEMICWFIFISRSHSSSALNAASSSCRSVEEHTSRRSISMNDRNKYRNTDTYKKKT